MADPRINDSNSEVSSVYDEGSSDVESLDGSENAVNIDHERQERVDEASAASQAAKAIEAATERDTDSFLNDTDHAIAGPSQEPYPFTTTQTAWEADTPVLNAGPAPPDYYAATAWRRASPATTVDATGGVVPTLQDPQNRSNSSREDPRDPEIQSRDDPETPPYQVVSQEDPAVDTVNAQEINGIDSLGGSALDETSPLLSQSYISAKDSMSKRSRAVSTYTRRSWCMLFAVFIVVGILVTTLAAFAHNYKASEMLKHPSSHGTPALDHPKTSRCSFDSYSDYVDIEVGDAVSFSLSDMIDFYNEPELQDTVVTGNVEIIYVRQNSSIVRNSSIVVRVHMATVLPWKVEMWENVTYDKHGNDITIGRPNLWRSNTANGFFSPVASPPCLDVSVVLYVREHTVLEHWWYLNFIDHDTAVHRSTGTSPEFVPRKSRLFVANETRISSQKGNVELGYWNSNDTDVQTYEGSITGAYLLHSKLVLLSESGNIDVSIDSTLEDKHETESILRQSRYERLFQTRTQSGRTRVRFQQPSAREDSSDLLHDFIAEHNSTQPITNDAHSLTDKAFWENSFSYHHSNIGSLSLSYPSRWSGNISGFTLSGKLSIGGDDVEIDSDNDSRGTRELTAHKGIGPRRISFESTAGDAALYIGDG